MERTYEELQQELEKLRELDLIYEEYERRRKELYKEWYQGLEVGDHVHVCLWSDIKPATVIRRTATTLTIRYDKAVIDSSWEPNWVIGGFSAVCTNSGQQRWLISEDSDGSVERFRWSKRGNCYMHEGLRLFPGWLKFYDFNF